MFNIEYAIIICRLPNGMRCGLRRACAGLRVAALPCAQSTEAHGPAPLQYDLWAVAWLYDAACTLLAHYRHTVITPHSTIASDTLLGITWSLVITAAVQS